MRFFSQVRKPPRREPVLHLTKGFGLRMLKFRGLGGPLDFSAE
jgi:hypothetical protein